MKIININDAPILAVGTLETESMKLRQAIGQHCLSDNAVTFSGQGWELTLRPQGDGIVWLEGNYVSDNTPCAPAQANDTEYSAGLYATTIMESLPLITKSAFRGRFTAAEKTTIELNAADNPAATMDTRMNSANIRVMLADLADADYVNLQAASVVAGINSLEQAGILAAGRAAQVLSTVTLPEERFKG